MNTLSGPPVVILSQHPMLVAAFVIMKCVIIIHIILQSAYEYLKQLYNDYGLKIVKESTWKSAKDAKHLMESRRISISVLGLHNSGKSTVTNALLGDEYVSCSLVKLVYLLYYNRP